MNKASILAALRTQLATATQATDAAWLVLRDVGVVFVDVTSAARWAAYDDALEAYDALSNEEQRITQELIRATYA